MPWTYKTNPFMNLGFAICLALCTYFYFKTMLADPGYIPKLGSRNQQKAVIEELLAARKFDEQHFCVTCMVRKPLRSKHCKRCNRCVAKEDHHCPWVDNCIATNNHRSFVLYIVTMELGIVLFVWLCLSYLQVVPVNKMYEGHQCNVLRPDLCELFNKDSFTIVLLIWTSLQFIWATMLLFVQFVQIARATTTYESMKGHGHGHGAGDALTSFVTTGSTSMEDAQVTGADAGPTPGTPHHHSRRQQKEGCWTQWKRLLGLDTFVMTALHGSRAGEVQRQARSNPFNRGIMSNCKDFWCEPGSVFGEKENGEALLGGERVNYTKLYEPPPRMDGRWAREEVQDQLEAQRMVDS